MCSIAPAYCIYSNETETTTKSEEKKLFISSVVLQIKWNKICTLRLTSRLWYGISVYVWVPGRIYKIAIRSYLYAIVCVYPFLLCGIFQCHCHYPCCRLAFFGFVFLYWICNVRFFTIITIILWRRNYKSIKIVYNCAFCLMRTVADEHTQRNYTRIYNT